MTVTLFHFRFYICVQIFFTIELLVKIFLFWANGPLKCASGHVFLTRSSEFIRVMVLRPYRRHLPFKRHVFLNLLEAQSSIFIKGTGLQTFK